MLHCWRLQLAGSEVMAPHDLGAGLDHLDVERAQEEILTAADPLQRPPDDWDAFAGGLSPQILDDTSWDSPVAVANGPYSLN